MEPAAAPQDLLPASTGSESLGPWQWPAPCKLQGEEAGESFSVRFSIDFPIIL